MHAGRREESGLTVRTTVEEVVRTAAAVLLLKQAFRALHHQFHLAIKEGLAGEKVSAELLEHLAEPGVFASNSHARGFTRG